MTADAHLTYIASSDHLPGVRFGETVLDVYPRAGGRQLGWVIKRDSGWKAVPNDPQTDPVWARTRREAATTLWGVADE